MGLNVYEAMNMSLKERFISTTALPVGRLRERHKSQPPPFPAHWDFKQHEIVYNDLMQASSEQDAESFIRDYKYSTPVPGWKLL